MSSLSDILTVAKNIVTAINGVASTYLDVQGLQNKPNISAATLVQLGQGRVAMVSVTTAGSTAGSIYDTNAVGSTLNKVLAIPNVVGVTFVNMPVSLGIVVVPGTSQVVTVTYS